MFLIASLKIPATIPFKGRADGFPPRSKRPRIKNIPGVATTIGLPVDLLWPGWIYGRLQNCSGIGRSRWLCGTHISPRNTRRRQSIAWSLPRGGWRLNRRPEYVEQNHLNKPKQKSTESKEVNERRGGRARLNAPDSKSDIVARLSGVRIPPSPP